VASHIYALSIDSWDHFLNEKASEGNDTPLEATHGYLPGTNPHDFLQKGTVTLLGYLKNRNELNLNSTEYPGIVKE
jgi:hypothetical protein